MFPDTNYMHTPHNNPFHIGQRSIKTAAAATVVAMIYLLFGGNPTFACIGAIFGLGNDMSMSRLNGGNRFFGTIIGGMVGMALFRLYIVFIPDGKPTLLTLAFLFVGVVVLISACQAFKWPGGIQPGGVVLCIILFNTPVDTYISYSVFRMIDTGVGVAVALVMNWYFTRERVEKILTFLHLPHHAEQPELAQVDAGEPGETKQQPDESAS